MTVATAGLMLVIIYQILFVKNKSDRLINYISVLIFFELFANSGKMLAIGGVEVQYSDVIWLILLLYALFAIIKGPINRTDFIDIFLFIVTLLVLVLVELLHSSINSSFSFRSILIFARFVIMSIVFVGVLRKFGNEEIHKLLSNILIMQNIMYAVCIMEVILKLTNSSLYFNLISIILGYSENQVNWLVIRGGMPALQGLCKEPSHFAICLLFASLFDLWLIAEETKIRKCFWINCILLVISGSFSSILFFTILISMYLVKTRGINKYVIALIIIFMIGPVSLWILQKSSIGTYYLKRLTNVMSILKLGGNVDSYTSEGQRLFSVTKSLELFMEHPFIGNGIGKNISTGAFPALLSSLGVLGTVAYFIAIVRRKKVWIPLGFVLIGSFFAMDMGVFYSSYFILFVFLFERIEVKYRALNEQ